MRGVRRALAALGMILLVAGCAGASREADAPAKAALAPTGSLRVGVYAGSPTSFIPAASGSEPRGVAYDLGREFAQRLGVPFQPVVFPNNAQLLDAVKAGTVDLVLTNATPARRQFIDFSATVLEIEKGYLVPAGSAVKDASAVDRLGMRVGVSEGSSSQSELARELRHASLVPVPTLKDAGRQLSEGKLDAFGTNKAILFELGDGLPGSRVLPGRWGLEAFAFGIPKGRAPGLAYLDAFARSVRAGGGVSHAAARAGLRGTREAGK